MTEWKDVIGYEGLYEVSNEGIVRSIVRNGTLGGLMKTLVEKGYERVGLRKNNKQKHHLVHRLAAEAFISNPENKPFVNHIDGIKVNNHFSNLEWATASENQKHAYISGLQKVNVIRAHKVRHEQTKVKVQQLDMDGNYLRTFDSVREAAKSIGIKDGTHISAVARGKRKKCGGFKWKYLS